MPGTFSPIMPHSKPAWMAPTCIVHATSHTLFLPLPYMQPVCRHTLPLGRKTVGKHNHKSLQAAAVGMQPASRTSFSDQGQQEILQTISGDELTALPSQHLDWDGIRRDSWVTYLMKAMSRVPARQSESYLDTVAGDLLQHLFGQSNNCAAWVGRPAGVRSVLLHAGAHLPAHA